MAFRAALARRWRSFSSAFSCRSSRWFCALRGRCGGTAGAADGAGGAAAAGTGGAAAEGGAGGEVVAEAA